MTISITKLVLIAIGLLLLFFTVIRPAIARGVCYSEAFRRDYRTQEPYRSGDYPDKVKLDIASGNREESYKTCKAFSAGKIWENWIFTDLKL